MAYYGYKNYCEFIQGQLPLIISIPHGGYLSPFNLPDRNKKSSSLVLLNDMNTQEIGRELFELIRKKFEGRTSYMIINHLHRRKVDVNRSSKEGAEISETLTAWFDYHNYLRNAIEEIKKKYSNGLLIDIHGTVHRYVK